MHSIIDWTSILCIQVGKNSMGDFGQVALHSLAAPFAITFHQYLRREQAFSKMLNSVKNSKENHTTDFEKNCNIEVSLANWNLLDHIVSISDCSITQNGFITNGAPKIYSQKN